MKIMVVNEDGRGGEIAFHIYLSSVPNNTIILKIEGIDGKVGCCMSPDDAEEIGSVLTMMARKVKQR